MNPLLRDLLGHQYWADAELWNAIGSHAAAREDKAIHDRLHHIHQVQWFFVWAIGGGPQPAITTPGEYPAFDDLRRYARESHDRIGALLQSTPDSEWSSAVTVPWFRDPPLTISAAEALTQMAMHSHHHRGQNAARLRELGGEPPTVDLIVWYWKGRPSPDW